MVDSKKLDEKHMTAHSKSPKKQCANPVVSGIGGQMYENKDKTGDIKFKVDGEVIFAHKCVLASLSPKYDAQFYGGFNDKRNESIEVKEVTAAAFKEFLQFFYLNPVDLTHANIEHVMSLAKLSLVDEFVTVCIDFLTETLSIENVCLTYHLAVLYDCENLMDCCEREISSHSDEVFASNGFITCNRVALVNILQLDSLNCNETDIFNACIAWAKNYCIEHGMDAKKSENLRNALDQSLFQIRFGTMSVEDFMRCFKSYKNIFTEAEREEILYMIGEIEDTKPTKFNDEPRGRLYQKWDESTCMKCDRISAVTPSATFYFAISKTAFSCNRPILLSAFFCGCLAETFGSSAGEKNVETGVTIVRKHQLHDQHGKVLLKGTNELTFKTKEPAIFKLHRPLLIKPCFVYEILVEFKKGFSMKNHTFKNEVYLDNQTVVQFHGTQGPVTCLKVNICNEKSGQEKK